MRFHPLFALLCLLAACRSTEQSTIAFRALAFDSVVGKSMPMASGDGYVCGLDGRGRGRCLGAQEPVQKNAGERWQILRAEKATPLLSQIAARSSVACGFGMQPSHLENRILCWQPQTIRSPANMEQDAVLVSEKAQIALRSLALQKDKVFGLLADGRIVGADLNDTVKTMELSPVKGLGFMTSVRSGEGFSCGVRGDTGAIFCWGDNSHGQMGLGGSLQEINDPVAIAGFSGFATAVDAGSQHACGINQAGEVLCWGDNSDQQVAQEGERHLEPQLVRGLPDRAASLALGAKHSCAQLVNGSVWCWGAYDALGSETQGGAIPVRVPLPAPSKQIAASQQRSCSLLANGEHFCWGLEPEGISLPLD